ncbi:WW domain-binding protein 1 [Melopsittacus undulatus]|uniref:WW domain-binding protein 1 n=1 Tax=Melopsittacus undulatus TaxID=13146 RepID=UPI00146A3589|nr:WW domain-binding protein 1 [Melopsittacus undulatus]
MERRGGGGASPQPRQAREHCPGVNNRPYVCETGHCCGDSGCCTYYYELWWFWLLWTILLLLSCCCAYRHRRAKLRLQQQQRQREINLIAYHGACSYPSSMMDLRLLASFKLPAYEEVTHGPGSPPPPYSAVLVPYSAVLVPRSSSLSSERCSSCSCGCSCATSPSSTSLSAPGTDATSTTSEDGGSSGTGSTGTAGSWELPQPCGLTSSTDLCEADAQPCSDIEEGEEEEGAALRDEGTGGTGEHFRHRRLTGDSGIEVGRCQEEEEEGEGSRLLSKASPSPPPPYSEGPSSPVLPI